jgi:hypothetical protein
VVLARAEATLLSARAFVFDICEEIDATAAAGDDVDLDQRTRMLLAALNAHSVYSVAVRIRGTNRWRSCITYMQESDSRATSGATPADVGRCGPGQ